MSLSYRPISFPDHAESIWQAELKMPRWWIEANAVWVKSYAEFLTWGSKCECHGLFDADQLIAVVYLEFLNEFSVNIHVSVISKVRDEDLVRFFTSLKNQKAIEGVRMFSGWMLERNRGLIRLAAEAGFRPNGLKMDFGASRSKILRWIQVIG